MATHIWNKQFSHIPCSGQSDPSSQTLLTFSIPSEIIAYCGRYAAHSDLSLSSRQLSAFSSEEVARCCQYATFSSAYPYLSSHPLSLLSICSEAKAQSGKDNPSVHLTSSSPLPLELPFFQELSLAEAEKLLGTEGKEEKNHGAKEPFLSAGARATEDVVADISYMGRTLAQLGADSPVYQAIGVTTGENVFQGFYAAFKAWERYQHASTIRDFGGKLEGGLDTLRGIVQGIGGACYLGYRGLMIASEVQHVNTTVSATTTLGKATFTIGLIGNFFFTFLYLFMTMWGGYHLYRVAKRVLQIKGVEKDQLAPYLLAQAHADTHVKLQKLQKTSMQRQEKFKKDLKDIALDKFAHQFSQWQKELKREGKLQGKELSHSHMKEVVEALFAAIDADQEARKGYVEAYCAKLGITPEEVAFLNLSPIEVCGLKIEEQQRHMRKEARLERVLGDKALKEIKDAYINGLEERLISDDPRVRAVAQEEAVQLEKAAGSALRKNLILYGTIIAIGILGLAVSIAMIGLFTLPPGWALPVMVLMFLASVAMMGVDLYSWKAGLESGPPGKYDKLFVGVAASILLISLLLATALTFGLGFPLMPFVFTVLMGVMGVGVCLYSLGKLYQREKRWKEEHLDLESFGKVLEELSQQDIALDERTCKLFKKLPKKDRHDIRAYYLAHRAELSLKGCECTPLEGRDLVGGYLAHTSTLEGERACSKYMLLQRAAKKTSKVFWDRWHHHHRELDKQRALQVHTWLEILKSKKKDAIRDHLRIVQEDHEVYETFIAHVYYLRKREESIKTLKEIIHALSTQRAEKNALLEETQIARVGFFKKVDKNMILLPFTRHKEHRTLKIFKKKENVYGKPKKVRS